MSACPGTRLEDYVAWIYDVSIVQRHAQAIGDLGFQEGLGMAATQSILMTQEMFAPVLAIFEPYREYVEATLRNLQVTDSLKFVQKSQLRLVDEALILQGRPLLALARLSQRHHKPKRR